jgi:hypothetical protein
VSPEIRAEVKTILYFGPEAARDAGPFEPADRAHFGVNVQVLIGRADDELADSFDLFVCSPSWFAAEVANGRWFPQGAPLGMPEAVAVGSGLWFMRQWERERFQSLFGSCAIPTALHLTGGSVAARIGRQIPWEFDYMYDGHVDERFGSPFPDTRDR